MHSILHPIIKFGPIPKTNHLSYVHRIDIGNATQEHLSIENVDTKIKNRDSSFIEMNYDDETEYILDMYSQKRYNKKRIIN